MFVTRRELCRPGGASLRPVLSHENHCGFSPRMFIQRGLFCKMKKGKRSHVKTKNFIVNFDEYEDLHFHADLVNLKRLQEFFDSDQKTMKMGIFEISQEKVEDEHGQLMPLCKVTMPRFPLAKREKYRHAFAILSDIRAGRRTDPKDAHLLRKVMNGNQSVLEGLFSLESAS